MTQRSDERAKLSSSRAIASSLTVLGIAVIVSPQISGGGDLQRSLTITTIVFAVVGFGLYLWCFASTREAVARTVDKVSLRDTAGMLDAWIVRTELERSARHAGLGSAESKRTIRSGMTAGQEITRRVA